MNIGTQDNGWTEVKFLDQQLANSKFAMNNAYYLMAEMNQVEGGGHQY